MMRVNDEIVRDWYLHIIDYRIAYVYTHICISGLSFIYYIYLYLFMFKLIYDESGAPVFFPDDIQEVRISYHYRQLAAYMR